ncbi:hypothetical protein ABBQ38_004922 [Trebouxia sp. C0009 RCD-2024]
MAEAASVEAPTAAMSHSKDAVPSDTKPVDVQALMKSDPRFIARLIQQLDTQMHNMQDEKKRRQQDTLNKRLQQKEQKRTALRQQLETQSKTFSSVEKDAQALLHKALHAARKVTRENASGLLKEVRGYNAAEPTTQLIKGKHRKV